MQGKNEQITFSIMCSNYRFWLKRKMKKFKFLSTGINLVFCAVTSSTTINSKLEKYLHAYRKPQFLLIWKIMYNLVWSWLFIEDVTAKKRWVWVKIIVLSVMKDVKGTWLEAIKPQYSCLGRKAYVFTSYHYTMGPLLTPKGLQKVFRSYGEIRETKMFSGTSLPNLLSLTSQKTN